MSRRRRWGPPDFDFTVWWKRGLIISTILVVVSLGSIFTRGLNMGFDFEGGVSWEVRAPGVSVAKVRDTIGPFGLGEAKIQIVGSDTIRVQGPAGDIAKQGEVREALAGLGGVDVSEVNVSTVGPTWGGEITRAAGRALVIFLLVILAYLTIRLEWQMAVGAVVALLHDIVFTVGFYSVFQIEIAPATVIAFLTILGYSIYDTVVVFGKAQENEAKPGLVGRMTYTDMMGLSMNQVLVRSINTTVTSLIPVVSLLVVGAYIMGATTIEEFATALTIGLFVGAYSSIFIAPLVVIFFKEREPRNRSIRERLEGDGSRSRGRGSRESDAARRVDGADGAPRTGGGTAAKDGDRAAEKAAAKAAAKAGDDGDGGRRGESGGSRSPVVSSNAIPPRPRKKGRKR